MRTDQKNLPALDNDVCFLDLGPSGTDRLDLPALERNPGLEAFFDEILMKRFPVVDDAQDGTRGGRLFYPVEHQCPAAIRIATRIG